MRSVVLCLVRTFTQLEHVMENLEAAGFSCEDFSVLLPDRHGVLDSLGGGRPRTSPEAEPAGRGDGDRISALARLTEIGPVEIPDLGPVIAVGPIKDALGSDLLAALSRLGVPEVEAKLYESGIRQGNILMFLYARDRSARQRAQRMFAQAAADDICSAGAES